MDGKKLAPAAVVVIVFFLAVIYLQLAFSSHAAQKDALLEKIANLSEAIPYAKARSIFFMGYEKMIEEGRTCLQLDTEKAHKQCWGDMRRKVWLDQLALLDNLSGPQRTRFQDPIQHWEPFDVLPPTYECDYNNLKRVGGDGDEGKWVCEPLVTETGSCVIVVLGANGRFHFERAVKEFTKGSCKIFTFDCINLWKGEDSTTLYPWCVSSTDHTDDSGRIFKRLSTIMKELNLTGINYLKVGTKEAGEWQVLKDILQSSSPPHSLPHQISFELHVDDTVKSTLLGPTKDDWLEPIVSLGRLIDGAGYRVAISERDVVCPVCNEYVIVKSPLFETGN